MTNLEHNRLLYIFFYIQGGLQLFGGMLAAVIYGGMGTFIAVSGNDPDAVAMAGIMVVLGIVIVALTLAVAGFYIFTAWKIQKQASSGRILGIIASVLCLLNIPIGTALGIYGLWFLTGEKGKELYLGGNGVASFPPPPPSSWQ